MLPLPLRNPKSPLTPFPRGWFLLAMSDELAKGQVKSVRYFARELVLFRDMEGVARCVDAYCPHLGAHLGEGGTVEGNCIRCPFHGWRYDGETGRCAGIPYAAKVPPNARVNTWPVHETAGMILGWYHEEGGAPSWMVPELPDVFSDEFTPWKEARWTVRTVIQDISENDLDSAHLPNLHQFTSSIPSTEVELDESELRITLDAELNLEVFGIPGSARSPVITRKFGLGIGWISFRVDLGVFTLEVRTLGNTTPIDAFHCDLRLLHSIRKLPTPEMSAQVDQMYFGIFKQTVEQDIRIWENKRHLVRPLLCEKDGPIAQYRRWARQFYAEQEIAQVLG